MYLEHYQNAAAFRQKILDLTEKAVEGLSDAPTLVAFPEAIGFPLLLTLVQPDASQGSVQQVAVGLARAHWQTLLKTAWQHRTPDLRAFYLWRALPAYQAYTAAFSEAAATYGVTISAGTSFLPPITREPVRGLHVSEKKIYNTAYTFSESGFLLGQTCKLFLNSGLESRIGLSKGRLGDLRALETPVGKLGTAICLDGFHSSVLDHLDGLGTQIIVQPSANHAFWERHWSRDTSVSEGEAWLRYGLREQLQNRMNIQYGVNPMLVGDVWDLSPRGRSSIVANTRFCSAELEGYPGLLAIAPTPDEEALVQVSMKIVMS